MKIFSKLLLSSCIGISAFSAPAFSGGDPTLPLEQEKEAYYQEVLDNDKGTYITGSLGLSKIGDLDYEDTDGTIYSDLLEFDTGGVSELGIGYDFGTFRIEGTWNKSHSDQVEVASVIAVDMESEVNTYLGSIYYDFSTNSKWTPFVGASLGRGSWDTKLDGIKDDASGLAYGIQGGVNYQTSDSIDVYGKLSRVVIPELDFDDGSQVENTLITSGTIGVRFRF